MNMFKAFSPVNPRYQEVEFSLLLGWALLYPAKIGTAYYLGFMALLSVFALGKLATLRVVAVDRFAHLLLALNAVILFSSLFSRHPLKSLLFAADVLLVSLWSLLLYLEKEDMDRYLRLAALVVSLSSLAVLAAFAWQGGRLPVAVVFRNPILQGIMAALAALFFLQRLLSRFRRADLLLLALNSAAVAVSASKAALLGLVAFAAALLVARRRRWLALLGAVVLILAVVPNPLRRAVGNSLRHDPYVFDRIEIWRMSARMFRARPWTGAGPDLFAEAAPRFNFAQDKGPSRYGKVPESPHSDYWRMIVENGLPGLVLVVLLLFAAIRRLLTPPCLEPGKVLLAFLLAQMLLFNFIFHFPFLILFLLLLKNLFSARPKFVPFRPEARLFVSAALVALLALLYVFPHLADRCLGRAERETDLLRRFQLLRRAALLSPLDERAPLAKARLLGDFARIRGDANAWSEAVACAQQAQRLDRNNVAALLLEAGLFQDARAGGGRYPAQAEEILEPLRRAEALAPFDPFLRLRQALVLREFGREDEARQQLRAALALEPDFAAALVLLHRLQGGKDDDPVLREKVARIRAKAERLRARPGSYLFNLHRLDDPAKKE
jgi:O-antigen ligase